MGVWRLDITETQIHNDVFLDAKAEGLNICKEISLVCLLRSKMVDFGTFWHAISVIGCLDGSYSLPVFPGGASRNERMILINLLQPQCMIQRYRILSNYRQNAGTLVSFDFFRLEANWDAMVLTSFFLSPIHFSPLLHYGCGQSTGVGEGSADIGGIGEGFNGEDRHVRTGEEGNAQTAALNVSYEPLSVV